MNLAFCLFRFFPYGGLQRDFLKIAQECLRRGHAVHVLTTAWEGEVPLGLVVHPVPVRGLSNHRRTLDFARRTGALLATGNFDAAVGFVKMPGLDFYFAADPCFAARGLTERSWFYRLGPRFRSYRRLEQAVFDPGGRTRIFILAEAEKEKYQRIYETPEERFHLLPPGIARDRVAPADAGRIRKGLREEFRIGENEHLLLMVGSAFRTKGLDRVMIALAALPPDLRRRTRLIVLGTGDARPFLREASRLAISDRLCFLGGRDDVLRFMLGADLLVHPAYTEAYGMVLLEAMAAGLPVLVTDICGFAVHVSRAEAGRVIPGPFVQETFNTMLAQMLMSSEKEKWQSNGRNYVARTDIFSLPEKAADLIETASSRGRR